VRINRSSRPTFVFITAPTGLVNPNLARDPENLCLLTMPNPDMNVKVEANPAPTSPSKKRKAPPSSNPDDPSSLTTSSSSSPSKQARPNDPRHKFYGSVQKSGAWTTEEDKKLFQHLFPKAVGVNWEVVARDIEGRSLHVSQR